eukprot:74353_1
MRFTVSQVNGCDMDENVYKHMDSADNSYYFHFVPERMDETNETLTQRWLVSRDYVSDVALFWCDSWDLMQCTKGEWSKNVFEELGVSQEVDGEITIKKCASIDDDAARQEEASAVIIPVVIIAVLLVIVGLSLYLFTRYRSKQKMKQMKVIVDNEEEADEEELDVTVPVITN